MYQAYRRDFFDKKGNIYNPKKSQITTANTSSSDSIAGFLEDDNYEENSELLSQVKSVSIEKEKLEFYKKIVDKYFEVSSTKSFLDRK